MINSIRLENFKNFRDATLNLGPFTVIVGANASGKSNLRDAFRFLHGIGRGYSLPDIIGEKFVDGVRQWTGIRGGTREVATFGKESFSIQVNLDHTDKSQFQYRIEVSADSFRPIHVHSESLRFENRLAFEADLFRDGAPNPRHLAAYDRDGKELTFNEAIVYQQLPYLSIINRNLHAPAYAQACCNSVSFKLRSMRFLDFSPDATRVPSIPGQPLGDRGENLSSVLLSICEDKSLKAAMMEWIRQLTPIDVVDFEFPTDQVGRVLVSLKEANGNLTSAFSASDGTLRFLALLASLMGPDPARFYFLEEIDNGIHPARLALLMDLLQQQTKSKGIQVITTSHSPQLLNFLSDESRQHAYLVYRPEHQPDAELIRLVDIPSADEVFQRESLGHLHESGWFENTVGFARHYAGGK